MKFLIVIVDGMADLPIGRLKGRTPLQAADTVNMNWLASKGSSGLMDPIAPGIVPDSDLAHLNILGFDPAAHYTGRGPLEAAGAGIDMSGGGIYYRCNLCELDSDGTITNEKAGLSKEDWSELEAGINEALSGQFGSLSFFKHTSAYRGVLVIRGDKISPAVSFPQPKRLAKAAIIQNASGVEASRTAEMLNRFKDISSEFLEVFLSNPEKRHAIIPWSGGLQPKLMDFCERHGMRGAGIAGVPLIKGICRLCGMSVIEVQGATGGPDTNTVGKARGALEAFSNNSLVLLHIEATDELGHDGDLEGKIKMIEKVDTMVGFVIDRLDLENTRIVVLSDHITSTELRRHTGNPVPVVIAGGRFPIDGLKEYSEAAARKGSLGRFSGCELLPILFK